MADLGWARPTLIQEKAIPLALDGKDLLARARTGSGKTGAYAIPVLQLLLHRKAVRRGRTRIVFSAPAEEVVPGDDGSHRPPHTAYLGRGTRCHLAQCGLLLK